MWKFIALFTIVILMRLCVHAHKLESSYFRKRMLEFSKDHKDGDDDKDNDDDDNDSSKCDLKCFETTCGTCAGSKDEANRISEDCDFAIEWNGKNGGPWSTLPSLPKKMGDNSGALVIHHERGKVLVTFGSYWRAGAYGYFFDNNSWERITPPPEHGDHMEAVVVGNIIYVIGGEWKRNDGDFVQIYDIDTDSWKFGEKNTWSVGAGNAVLIDNKIYVCGGIDDEYGGTTNQCGIYDPTADKWSDMKSMPYGRNHAAYGTDGNKFFIMTGRGKDDGKSNGNKLKFSLGYDTVQIYDPASDTWVTSRDEGSDIPPSPVPRAGVTVAVYYNKEFWLIGGSSKQDKTPNPCIKLGPNHLYYRTDIYNPITKSWREGPDMHFAAGATTPVFDAETEKIYLPGGATRENRSKPGATFQVLDLKRAATEWSPLPKPQPAGSRLRS